MTDDAITDDEYRSIIHSATHRALPVATNEGIRHRAHLQVAIADFIIGAIRAREAGEAGFGGMYFHRPPPSPMGGEDSPKGETK